MFPARNRREREREGARSQLLGGPDGPQPLPVFRVQDPGLAMGVSSPRPQPGWLEQLKLLPSLS